MLKVEILEDFWKNLWTDVVFAIPKKYNQYQMLRNLMNNQNIQNHQLFSN